MLAVVVPLQETKVGRWSALTLDRVAQDVALWQRNEDGAKSAEILAAAAAAHAPQMAPERLACVIEGLAAAGAYSLPLLRAAEKVLEPHLEHLDQEVRQPAQWRIPGVGLCSHPTRRVIAACQRGAVLTALATLAQP